MAQVIAGTVAKEAAEAAAKEAAKVAARESAKIIAKEAAEAAAKEAAKKSIMVAVRESVKISISQAKNFVKQAKTFGSKIARTKPFQIASKAADASAEFIKKNPKIVLGGMAAGAIAAVVLDKFAKKNDKTYGITKILNENAGGFLGIGGKRYLKVFYSSSDKLEANDVVVLDDTDSVVTSNGTYTIYKSGIENGSRYVLLEAEEDVPIISKEGTKGDLVYKTTFETQLKAFVEDVGGETTSIFNKVFPNIPPEYVTYLYIFIALVIISIAYNYVYLPLSHIMNFFSRSATFN